MSKEKKIVIDEELNKKCEEFIRKINSEMKFTSNFSSDLMQFDWFDEFELICPYIDNIVRRPKVTLIKEEDVVLIEKAKKINVASVKDLSKKTHYIESIDEDSGDVQPSKILIERNEETFNTYENRFIYTLIYNLTMFVTKQEEILNYFEIQNNRTLEYKASNNLSKEKINIELKIDSIETLDESDVKNIEEELEKIRKRFKRIKDFISSWNNSEMITSLAKQGVPLVLPPIKKTNLILKNPNFQMANRLWDYLQMYDEPDEAGSKNMLDTEGDDILRGVLDDAFLMNYFILDSISSSKREQRDKLYKYAIVMMNQQLKRIISLLLAKGVKITDEEILQLVAKQMKIERDKVNSEKGNEVKKKFRSAFEDYVKKAGSFFGK